MLGRWPPGELILMPMIGGLGGDALRPGCLDPGMGSG